MQCSIKFDESENNWIPSKKGKIPPKCREIFNELIKDLRIYDGNVPPFFAKSITHEEWLKIKRETDTWNDVYIEIPSNIITKLYLSKGCKYIQISDGFGLYHLGVDVCCFGVPLLDIPQQLRIRTKIHKRKNKKGFCSLSVTAACQPKKIKDLIPSRYSLDNKDKLPPNLFWQGDFNQ